MQTPVPPFVPGEMEIREVPTELTDLIRERIKADQQFEPLACVWFCEETRRCRHYEFRPEACRKFEIGSDLCRLSRWDAGV